MDTSHHVNGHAKKLVDHQAHTAQKTAVRVKKAVRRGKRTGLRMQSKAIGAVRSTERQLATTSRGVFAWVKANPKTAIGVGVGIGVAASVLATSKVARATLLGMGGLAYAVIKRFV
jgi:ElaB/YqjD/DUF883 family membrane-anchored ribosome-binding protein